MMCHILLVHFILFEMAKLSRKTFTVTSSSNTALEVEFQNGHSNSFITEDQSKKLKGTL